MAALQSRSWPGNVRELMNFMEKTMIFCRREEIDAASLPWDERRQDREAANSYSLKEASRRLEKEYIRKALAATGGNRTLAARLLETACAPFTQTGEHDLDDRERLRAPCKICMS